MFKHLLVPLDGSRLAESVIPVAEYLSRLLHIGITFIHIIEKDAPEKIHGENHITSIKEAEDYLRKISSNPNLIHSKTDWHVHESSVENLPESIIQHSEEFNNDLVLLCTHGKSGFKGIIFGSIAQKVIAKGLTPVLLIHPPKSAVTVYEFRNILVPVDGDSEHEQALDFAADFARSANSYLHLVMAVPEFGTLSGQWTSSNRFLPNTSTRMMDMVVADAVEYLRLLEIKLSGEGIEVKSSILREDPPAAISNAVKELNADLVVLGTHGKKGADAFWAGSVTPKVGKNVKVPLLLIPIKKTADEQ